MIKRIFGFSVEHPKLIIFLTLIVTCLFEASINVTDNMLLSVGINIFTGVKNNTTFGQYHKDSNLYVLARYNF